MQCTKCSVHSAVAGRHFLEDNLLSGVDLVYIWENTLKSLPDPVLMFKRKSGEVNTSIVDIDWRKTSKMQSIAFLGKNDFLSKDFHKKFKGLLLAAVMAEQNNSGILERFANTWNIFEIFRRYLQKFECKNLGDIYKYQEIQILDFHLSNIFH